MSVIESSQFIALPLLDMIPVEAGAANASPGFSDSFNDYLQRAQTSSTGAGDNTAGNSSRDAGQSPVPRADDSQSTADQPPPCPINNEDNIDNVYGEESADRANLPTSDSRSAENKDKPVEQDQAGSSINKKEKDDKKDKNDNSTAAPNDNNQDNQLNAGINAKTGNAKNPLQSESNASSIKAEQDEVSNALRAASKNAKSKRTDDSGPQTKTESLTSGTMQSAAAEGPDASVSASGKKKALGKTAPEEDKNAGEPAATEAIDTALAAGKGGTFAAKTSKDFSASSRNAQGKTANQNEIMQSSIGNVADAGGSPGVGQDVSAAAAMVNPSVLPPVVNPPIVPTTPAKDKIELPATDKPANIASDNKAADPANALQRLEQTGTKTTASAQADAEETGSDFNSVRFVQRVERAFAAMSDGGGTVRLRLSPPELGSLSMEISVDKGVMKARLEAETKEAKNLLLENLPALRDRLAQQNIKIQKFDVDLRDPSSGGMSQQTADQAQTGSGGDGYRGPRPRSLENGVAATTTTEGQRLANHNGQLNVIV